MKDKKTTISDPTELRRQAEIRLQERKPETADSTADIRKLLHELQVHQIELEMQNEELEAARLELEASRDRYAELYDFAPVGYCTLDEEGIILEANLTTATLLGVARGELLKKPLTRFVLRGDWDIYFDCQNALFETGDPQSCELQMTSADCGPFWAHLTAVVRRNLDGVKECGMVISDVTERKRSEEKRALLESQLHQAMKMEAVGRLAGGVAHDFNNLLTGITGNVDLALLDLAETDPLFEMLTEVNEAAHSAAGLTRQLLAFSRKQQIEPKVVDLNEVISSLHKMLIRMIGEDVELTATLEEGLGYIKVDPTQVKQILTNLAINARDAMPQGGKLVIKTERARLEQPRSNGDLEIEFEDFVVLSVSDTGLGMSAEVKSHLFEPFFTTKPISSGTGLGLATTYGAVEQMNGLIEVESKEGIGSTFKIYLPRHEGIPEAIHSDESQMEMPSGTETILLVEDEDIVRNLAVRLLTRLGYKVLEAPNGAEALNQAEACEGPIDMLMTDVVMPGMNGRQVADELVKVHPETKVLFTSGYAESIIAHDGVVDESLHFIAKPYSPRSLARKLRAVLDADE